MNRPVNVVYLVGEYMRKAMSLNKLLTEAALKEYAGRKIFARGLDYYESDTVDLLLEHGGKLLGKVEGTYEYTVRFWVEDVHAKIL